jgi:predicted phage terminase large subunit-like protein
MATATLASRSLQAFTEFTFPGYRASWSHVLICKALDAIVEGTITRLMLMLPPRGGKSEVASRRLPAYILGKEPDAGVIACSYSADLSSRFNRDVQRIMDTDDYRLVFPDTRLASENVRTSSFGRYLRNNDIFEIVNHVGFYRSAGVGGGITGMGGRYAIVDDPVKNAEEAASPVYRAKVLEWYKSTLLTRLEPAGRVVLIMTRWHEDDLAGALLREASEGGEPWHVIRLPAISTGPDPVRPYDVRPAGEPLWPDQFPLEALQRIKTAIGSQQWEALYQQNPMTPGGRMVKAREWIATVDAAPACPQRCRYWDFAATAASGRNDPDYTVGLLLGRSDDGTFCVLDLVRARTTPRGVENLIVQTALRDGFGTCIAFEEEPGSSGKFVADSIVRRLLMGYNVHADKVSGSKTERARGWIAQAEAGNLKLVRATWNAELLDELEGFPTGRHDDICDGISGAFAQLVSNPMRFGSSTVDSIPRPSGGEEAFGRERYADPFAGL